MLSLKRGLIPAILIFLIFWGMEHSWNYSILFASKAPPSQIMTFSKERQNHILYGDKTGGGHKAGVGKPCKSEFPKDWDDARIIREVSLIAANDNLNWIDQIDGRAIAEQDVDGTRVRVVIDRYAKSIVTAYPVYVKRNPCPANDNSRD
jgi:hypothetical protein